MNRLTLILLLAAAACDGERTVSPPPPPPPPPPAGPPALALVTDQLTQPVFAASPPGDSLRLFVVQRTGGVRIIRRDTLLEQSFLNLEGQIQTAGGEEGLLSIAFHPGYDANGRFYVYFTSLAGDLRVVRYLVSASDPDVADPASADTVLAVPHPTYANHNGGQLQFGPDGMLYAALGDGGSGGDPPNNAQNPHQLLGKLLRLNVDGTSGYTIPADNPFAGDTAYEPEIWALGLRNPWRFSFDPETGDLYVADVGQSGREEVNAAPATAGEDAGRGLNFGWRIMEGTECFSPSTGCDDTGLTLPVVEYPTGIDGTCAVTGGYVYRGARVGALAGHYLYADYCAGFVRSFRLSGGAATDSQDRTVDLSPGTQISSFARDGRGELYILTLAGTLHRIVEN